MEPSAPASSSRDAPSAVYVAVAPRAGHPTSAGSLPTVSVAESMPDNESTQRPAGPQDASVPEEEAAMNASLARALGNAGSRIVPNVVSREELDEVKRCLASLERVVSSHQRRHYRHGVAINSTRGRFRFLFDGERHRASDLYYDLRELRAVCESLDQRLLSLHGMVSRYHVISRLSPEGLYCTASALREMAVDPPQKMLATAHPILGTNNHQNAPYLCASATPSCATTSMAFERC